MLAAERRAAILGMLAEQGRIRTDEAARTLGVSVETVRRDLEQLHSTGDLVRVHGGAVPAKLPGATEPPFDAREATASAAKRAIAMTAVQLVSGARTIYLDIGTTAAHVARALPEDLEATVVTASIRVADILAARPGISVVVPGGTVRGGDLAISGTATVEFLGDIHPDIAFLGSGGVSPRHGLTDFEMPEVPVKRTVLRNAHRSFVLADASKVGVTAPYRVCDLAEVTGVITDHEPSEATQESFAAIGAALIIAA